MSRMYRLQITPALLRDQLGVGMYTDVGRCLAELFRNALVACMAEAWNPKQARIEIMVVENHPLAQKGQLTLIVLDHGSGMTDANLASYFKLGAESAPSKKGFGGASQKGIGRLAALALSRHSDRDECTYYVLSRTQEEGEIRFIKITPELLCREQGVEGGRFIMPSAYEMGPLRNSIKGSFTAIVIPVPVVESNDEVAEAIKWYLPREPEKMCELVVGGKKLLPPPLPNDAGAITVSSDDGRYRVYIGPASGKTTEHGGIWLADSETGFRVASCVAPNLRARGLPEPICLPGIFDGDILVPGLLAKQDTARSALHMDYTRTNEWKKLCLFLKVKVAPRLIDIMEQDPIMDDATKIIDGIADLLDSTWGPPPEEEETDDQVDDTETDAKKIRRIYKRYRKKGGIRRKRLRRVCVRGEIFDLVAARSLEQDVFAEPNIYNSRLIELNVRGAYKALPGNKAARNEHMLMQVLNAIARSDVFAGHDQTYPKQVSQLANALRRELLEQA